MTGVFSGCWLRAKGYRLLPAPAAGTAFACIPPGEASPIALPCCFWIGIEVNHVYRTNHPFAAGFASGLAATLAAGLLDGLAIGLALPPVKLRTSALS